MINYPNYPQVDNVPQTQVPQMGYPGYQQGFQVPGYQPQVPSFPSQLPGAQIPFMEQSYIENILRLNRGKVATVYMNFENSQWGSKIFKGEVKEAGKDHIILVDNTTGTRYILLTIYLNYITFDEPINYYYPFSNTMAQQVPSQTPSSIPQVTQPLTPTAPQVVSPFTQVRKNNREAYFRPAAFGDRLPIGRAISLP